MPDNSVERIAATATRVDTHAQHVELDVGSPVACKKLLLTTGGHNRRLEIPGADLPGVLQLRTVADCDAIKQRGPTRSAGPGGRDGFHRFGSPPH
jgi:3-phenylpropionate/trans-cinnamate dioxygenase ferredoxin reductase subunit